MIFTNVRNILWRRNILVKPLFDSHHLYVFVSKILFHKSILPDSLIYRFVNYFENCPKYSKVIVKPCEKGKYEGNSLLLRTRGIPLIENILRSKNDQDLTASELQQFIMSLSKENFPYPREFNRLLSIIDDACCEKLGCTADLEDIIKFNYAWLNLLGIKTIRLKQFKQSLKKFKMVLSEDDVCTPLIISMLFYSGLARREHMTKEIVALCLQHLCSKGIRNGLSNTEKVIVADVSFKTGCKIHFPLFIEHLITAVNKDIDNFVKDPVLLVTFVKMMCHNKYYDHALLKNMDKILCEDKSILQKYNFTIQTHLIALYADSLYGRHEFLNHIFDTAVRSMMNIGSHQPFEEGGRGEITNRVRAKDIARLVWASSHLGLKLNEEVVEKTILPMIARKVSKGAYKMKMDMLIDTVLSLWMMGYKPVELFPTVFSKEAIKYVSGTKRMRHKSRLLLLSTCVSIEAPEIMKSTPMDIFPSVDYYNTEEKNMLRHRPALKSTLQDIKEIVQYSGAVEIKCEYSVPSLNIPGISVKTYHKTSRSVFYIEVLDSTNCLKDTGLPFGLMLLKLRLLRKLGHRIILVNYTDHRYDKSNLIHEVEQELMKIKQN